MARSRPLHYRRHHLYGFAPNDRLMRLSNGLRCNLSLQSQPWNRVLDPAAQLVVTRTLVYHRYVVIGDIRYVGSAIENCDVLLNRHDRAFDPRSTELRSRDETILSRPNVVIAVGPVPNPGAAVKLRLWRKRRPPYIVVAFPPRDPCRGPFITRHPDPADIP